MTGSRLDHLDGLRALAALLVLCNHSWRMAWPRLQGDPLGRVPDQDWLLWTTGWARYGHFGVTLFIVLSGFCLMLPVAREGGRLRSSIGDFYLRRARRILPTYYAALACSLLLIWLFIGEKTGTQWDAQLPVTAAGVVSRLLMLQDVWEPLQINNPFWSIAVEWRIYFVFPLLVWAFQKWGPARVAAAGVAAVAAAMLIPVLRALSVGYLGMFLLGMLAASLAHAPEASPRHRRMAAIICLGAGAALLAYCLAHDFLHVSTRFRQLDFLAGLSAAAGLVFLSLTPGSLAARALRWKPLVVLGGFSYSVYLMHMPLLQLVWQYGLAPWGLGREASFFLLITLGWGLVLAGCRVFYHLFERPFLSPASPSGPASARTP